VSLHPSFSNLAGTREEPIQRTPKSAPSDSARNKDKQELPTVPRSFGLLDLQSYAFRWDDVPWSGKDAALGMLAWSVSFVGVGLAFIPLARSFSGPDGFAALSQQEKALFALANQCAETVVGLAIVAAIARKHRPLPGDILKVDPQDPFTKPDGWAAWGLLGVLLSPVVVYIASIAVETFGVENNAARGTADAISQILSLDGVTFAALFTTTAILAPILEETVFRGFLLVSLTKVMPTPLAVVLSALAFGFVHLSPRDTPQLAALGLLLGFSYVRSKNLLTPMLIHGVWNGTVLCVLYSLQLSGYDIQQLLHGGAS
jgi:uncharacterized protein